LERILPAGIFNVLRGPQVFLQILPLPIMQCVMIALSTGGYLRARLS